MKGWTESVAPSWLRIRRRYRVPSRKHPAPSARPSHAGVYVGECRGRACGRSTHARRLAHRSWSLGFDGFLPDEATQFWVEMSSITDPIRPVVGDEVRLELSLRQSGPFLRRRAMYGSSMITAPNLPRSPRLLGTMQTKPPSPSPSCGQKEARWAFRHVADQRRGGVYGRHLRLR